MNQANLQIENAEEQIEDNAIALTTEELEFVGGGECVVNSI